MGGRGRRERGGSLQLLLSLLPSILNAFVLPFTLYHSHHFLLQANLLFIASADEGSVASNPFSVPEIDPEDTSWSSTWVQANFHNWEVTDSIKAAFQEENRSLLLTIDTPRDAFVEAREETAGGYREMVTSIYPPAVEWENAVDY